MRTTHYKQLVNLEIDMYTNKHGKFGNEMKNVGRQLILGETSIFKKVIFNKNHYDFFDFYYGF